MANSYSYSRRLYRLSIDLIQILVPAHCAGTYLLFEESTVEAKVTYIGRSDTCLRSRLMIHARSDRAHFFDFEMHDSCVDAFFVECADYHTYAHLTTNRIHPDRPNGLDLECPFCETAVRRTLGERLCSSSIIKM